MLVSFVFLVALAMFGFLGTLWECRDRRAIGRRPRRHRRTSQPPAEERAFDRR